MMNEINELFDEKVKLSALEKLNKDLKDSSSLLSDKEAGFLVSLYYSFQEYRKGSNNQVSQLLKGGSPNKTLKLFANSFLFLEGQVKIALKRYTESKLIGQWLLSICGVGEIIAAGLISHIDITRVETAGQIEAFAGLDPTKDWLGAEKAEALVNEVLKKHNGELTDEAIIELKQKSGRNLKYIMNHCEDDKGKFSKSVLIKAISMRPWNNDLKVLCWKIGESFVKVSNNDKDTYGKIYKLRKLYEIEKNENLEYVDQAREKLEKYKIGKATEAYKYYSIGKLPPAHIDQRAKRYATKIFLSHLFSVWYELDRGRKPPKPYAISILGHAHEIPIPNMDIVNLK